MSNFSDVKLATQIQFESMQKTQLFITDINKDTLWEIYIDSFEPGTNPQYKERTEHDCQCCKQFIRAGGGIITIVNNELVSIWDIEVGGIYQPVVDALSKYVKTQAIANTFLHYEQNVGTDHNHSTADDNVVRWDHFFIKLPLVYVKDNLMIGSLQSQTRGTFDVFLRTMNEISLASGEIVLELIEQNSLYRGTEHKAVIELFITHKKAFSLLSSDQQTNYCWEKSALLGPSARIRNTVIGTLMVDISDGMELDDAVKAFEAKVAPSNYKRPTALITKGMIDKAKKKFGALGITTSLDRRNATIDDITINNIIHANRETKVVMDVFGELESEILIKPSAFDKVEEVSIDVFINSILPKADSIELLLENRHNNNLMTLIASKDDAAKGIFKWNNNFSWSYKGEMADSIVERVKKAGGNVNGILRASLSWFNYDDLDIHIREPSKTHIYYGNHESRKTGGKLDVDMNAGRSNSRKAVENIIYTDRSKLEEGIYEVWINQFSKRESSDVGFAVEIEFDGTVHAFAYDRQVVGNVMVAKFKYSHKSGIEFIESLPSTTTSKVVWELATHQFHKVNVVMNSPNHWDGEETGNKHWFFILDGCKNDKPARGFYNEFLKSEFIEHRKVFEVLASKMKTEVSDNQLSGLGFSSTRKNSVVCKVSGAMTRTIKINF